MPSSARGRPPKFGRPAQLLALTLPVDVVEWLRTIHRDPAWAIALLCEASRGDPNMLPRAHPDAELAMLGRKRGLIVVDERAFQRLPGVALISLSPGRALLALESGRGMVDLELAVLDRLDETEDVGERAVLAKFREQLRAWRRDASLVFNARAIIVAERRRRSRAPGTPQ